MLVGDESVPPLTGDLEVNGLVVMRILDKLGLATPWFAMYPHSAAAD